MIYLRRSPSNSTFLFSSLLPSPFCYGRIDGEKISFCPRIELLLFSLIFFPHVLESCTHGEIFVAL
ncbi:unnamed protein product [Coffea canephora]|uniref:Uncharacterized protein n=1 Tax=Coffea canephora TaxID=49390 RepID=A0A068UWW3_COFCA|nr:unnamed protein product [Coffea canephora]